METDF